MNKVMLAIVIPCYNESACIERVAKDWLEVLSQISGRLIIVNDGSKDDTGARLDIIAERDDRLLVIHQKNAGHGAAVLAGYRKALDLGPDFIFQTDSDEHFVVRDFWKLWSLREGQELVTGVRENRQDPWLRRVLSSVLSWMNYLLFGIWHPDANIPFRLFDGPALGRLLPYFPSKAFIPNIQLTVLALSLFFRSRYVMVEHRARSSGKSMRFSTLLKLCWWSLREMAGLRWALWRDRNRLLIPAHKAG